MLHGPVQWRPGLEPRRTVVLPDPWNLPLPFKLNQDRRRHIPKQKHKLAETLEVPRPGPCRDGEPLHLLVDSTGLKLRGAGEWLVEKHGTKTRRSPRKLHIGVDAGTGRIVAAALAAKEVDDGAEVGPLLD